ncbi:unnamed protein product, partial [Nesidiocoris tenuis]
MDVATLNNKQNNSNPYFWKESISVAYVPTFSKHSLDLPGDYFVRTINFFVRSDKEYEVYQKNASGNHFNNVIYPNFCCIFCCRRDNRNSSPGSHQPSLPPSGEQQRPPRAPLLPLPEQLPMGNFPGGPPPAPPQ